mmetsp:Transcript_76280/g.182530  ORF Transcript_76280/g.182530 Transcript_76280/m.182530 type:complete len:106 (-) Transcript_76280:357-674(-)
MQIARKARLTIENLKSLLGHHCTRTAASPVLGFGGQLVAPEVLLASTATCVCLVSWWNAGGRTEPLPSPFANLRRRLRRKRGRTTNNPPAEVPITWRFAAPSSGD